jgi:hypothetical protein
VIKQLLNLPVTANSEQIIAMEQPTCMFRLFFSSLMRPRHRRQEVSLQYERKFITRTAPV